MLPAVFNKKFGQGSPTIARGPVLRRDYLIDGETASIIFCNMASSNVLPPGCQLRFDEQLEGEGRRAVGLTDFPRSLLLT